MKSERVLLILLAIGAAVMPPVVDAQCNSSTQRLIVTRKYDQAHGEGEA